jgi:hypothetical protein
MAQQSYDVGDDPGDGRYDCEAAATADRTMLISIAATVVVFVGLWFWFQPFCWSQPGGGRVCGVWVANDVYVPPRMPRS